MLFRDLASRGHVAPFLEHNEVVHAAPFYCPYCAEEALEPFDPFEGKDARPAGWYCSSCDRRFSLKFEGLGAPMSAETA